MSDFNPAFPPLFRLLPPMAPAPKLGHGFNPVVGLFTPPDLGVITAFPAIAGPHHYDRQNAA